MGLFDKKNDRKPFDLFGKNKNNSQPHEETEAAEYPAVGVAFNSDKHEVPKDLIQDEQEEMQTAQQDSSFEAKDEPQSIEEEEWPRFALPEDINMEYTDEGVKLSFKLDKQFADEQRESVTRHLARKEISGVDTLTVMNALNEAFCEGVIIAHPQKEHIYDETYSISIASNQLEAYISILPADPAGGKRLDCNKVLNELKSKHGIRHGIDEKAVEDAVLSGKYDEPICIAHGMAPIPGEDGALEFMFDRREDGSINRMRNLDDEEKIDYKELDLFERVKQDQLLVKRILPKEGIPGITVLGQVLPAEAGKPYNLPVGKNTYISEDKMELRAKVSGSVEYINGIVKISHCYIVENVDMKVGNIDFDGDVIVSGNVLSGFSLKATGNIEIMGVAEAADVQAGGDIFIRGGIQGAGKGMLTAKGSIFVKFAENATVMGTEMVVAESLLHSNVSSFGPIEVLNGRGCIIGGNTCAGTYLAAQLIGNSSGRATSIEVGISPRYRARLLELDEQLKSLENDIRKIQVIATRPPRPNETQKQKESRLELMKTLLVQNRMRDDCVEEMDDLKGRMEEMKNGQVHVLREAYPGVKISIGLAQYSLEKTYPYATFRVREGEINFTNCRFKQMPVRPKRIRRS